MKRLYLFVLFTFLLVSCAKDTLNEGPAFTWNDETDVYNAEIGGKVFIISDITSREGINTIKVEIPAWSKDETSTSDLLEIVGSPRNYKLTYEINVSEKAEIGEHIVKFTVDDYSGNSFVQETKINVQSDNVLPELIITSPESNVEVEPEEILSFKLKATDNLKMKDVVISCPELNINETFEPENDAKTVEVDCNYNVGSEIGDYIFTIKATDSQLNVTESKVNVSVQYTSKPKIDYVESYPVCGVAGGTLPFKFHITTNEDHPIKNIKITCAALSINEEIVPEGQNVWQYDLDYSVDIEDNVPGQRDLEFTIKVSNDLDEISEYKGTLDIFDKVYAIGKGTLAKEKEGYSISMSRSTNNPNEFELLTWINVAGDGVKFLSDKNYDDYVWGLDDDGKVVSDKESKWLISEGTGYYKFIFNPTDWSYRVEPAIIEGESEIENLFLYGVAFSYWDETNSKWVQKTDWWDSKIPFKKHPENSNCFYIDVKTGSDGTDVAVWKISGQDKTGTEVFFGINATPTENGDGWDWRYWEYIGPVYKYDSITKIPCYKEDGRKGEVMRLMVDLNLNYLSWMSLKEQYDAGWTIYPPAYTPFE